ncbi:RagB/SusD family nutrient uptake outer membrane protein [Flagellimonas hymeniacidonis]|uniref:RagB/SusD family nutrient uptake outer membrane protein n=1 Tax=Flagellimonas hymeniacidonis TaxID=2603628 RepID=A0A5C8VAE5_9FLAO|nr:RagB/SusD family nutrient uptake outer membrane protein [Flagellimonas hymeniacidonis]TXN38120.1 RagB/SusD family nutrient uptake outer membrane protein [Flagellimonas hymeniacidonis]
MMRKKNFKNQIMQGIGVVVALLVAQSCTDLEPQFGDSVSVESDSGAFGGVANATNALETLYNGVENMGDQANEYALMEVSADGIAVLTRGVDWSDNGIWRTLHNHTWDAQHNYVRTAWNNRNAEVLSATQLLDPASGASGAIAAQARVLRAFNMFWILDWFGKVPFRGVNDGVDVNPEVLESQAAFDFILDDLNTAISSGNLSSHGPNSDSATLAQAGEAMARMLRAKLQLNGEAFTGSAGDMNAVISDVNAIEDLGYSLDPGTGPNGYFDIWDLDVTNTEVIWIMDTFAGNRMWNMLHPNQGGWNGFVTLTENFRLFGTENPAEDARIGLAGPDVNGVAVGYLRGQQLDASGAIIQDRQGNNLVFENELLQSLEVNNERTGLRLIKYPQRGADGRPNPSNNAVFFRFTDAVLMRAEATLRGGSGSPNTALVDVNNVRTRAGAAPLGSVALDDMLDIRMRELNAENWRRQDQVRFGAFAGTWELKTVTEEFRRKYPIPADAIATNPNLTQNEGY